MMPGMIMGWPWGVDTIPSGWHLCDGTMGTPDYRNCFLVGAGLTYDPGDAGGSNTHSHPFIGDGHSHDLRSGPAILDSSPDGQMDHSTSVSAARGDTNVADNRPVYKALCWIMKL